MFREFRFGVAAVSRSSASIRAGVGDKPFFGRRQEDVMRKLVEVELRVPGDDLRERAAVRAELDGAPLERAGEQAVTP